MAATEQAKDHVHRLTSAINTTIGGSLTVDRAGDTTDGSADNIINIADIFERNFSTYTNSRIQAQINYQPDILVLQFGENLASVSTDSEKAAFKASLETMLNASKRAAIPISS